MGKTLKIAGALLLICALTFTAATAFFIAASDDVEVLPKTLYGDPTAAEGLKVDFRAQYRSTLHWDIHCDPVTGGSHTDFIFNRDNPFYTAPGYSPRGVQMYALLDHRSHRFSWEKPTAVPEGSDILKFSEYLLSLPLLENEQNGSATIDPTQRETYHTVDLSDFFEYYPFEGEVDLFNTGLIPNWDVYSEYSATASEGSKILAKLFNGYFRIPVRDNATVQVNVFEYRDGRRDYYFGGFPEDSTFFYPEIYSFVVDNRCYFVFSETMGHNVSQIPGGWGIYRLDYTLTKSRDIATAQLSTVYALDTAAYVREMALSADGQRILLTTFQGSGIYLTVIDLATMSTLQEIEIYQGSEAVYPYMDIQEDFILTICANQLRVYQRLADGTYEQRIDVDLSAVGYLLRLDPYNHTASFDGEKLAIAQVLMRSKEAGDTIHSFHTCGYTLQIFDSTGLLYCGEYSTSLEPVDQSYLLYGDFNYANYYAPFQLTWE